MPTQTSSSAKKKQRESNGPARPTTSDIAQSKERSKRRFFDSQIGEVNKEEFQNLAAGGHKVQNAPSPEAQARANSIGGTNIGSSNIPMTPNVDAQRQPEGTVIPTPTPSNQIPSPVPAGATTAPDATANGGLPFTEGIEDIDQAQAVRAGVTRAAQGVAAGGVTGALGFIGGPAGFVTTPAGAAAGAVGGFGSAYLSNRQKQLNQKISVQYGKLGEGETFLKMLIKDTNKNPQNAAANAKSFENQIAAMELAYGNTHRLNYVLGTDDAQEELADFASFFSPGGRYEFYRQAMVQAQLKPDPNAPDLFTADDLSRIGV